MIIYTNFGFIRMIMFTIFGVIRMIIIFGFIYTKLCSVEFPTQAVQTTSNEHFEILFQKIKL